MKRLLSLLLAAIMLMSCNIVVTAEENESIELDQLYPVVFTENHINEAFEYSFTPKETDYYVIESFCEINEFGYSAAPYVSVYDDKENRIAYDGEVTDDSPDFGCACKLEKDKTYKIIIKSSRTGALNFRIRFTKLTEDFSIAGLEHYTFMPNTYYTFNIFANEENGAAIKGTWSISNNEVAKIYSESGFDYKMGWVKLYFLASGKFDLTFTSVNGISDSVEITVVDPIELTTDRALDFYVLPNQDVRFKFVPETSGYYEIYSECDGNFQATLYIYNEATKKYTYMASNEDGGQEDNFKLLEKLEAGKEYCIEVYGYYRVFGSLTVLVEKAVDPSSIDISKVDGLTFPVDKALNVEAVLSPTDSNVIVDWSVSDESVLLLNNVEYDENVPSAEFKTLKEGTVIITATTANGISDTATIYVCDKIILEEGVPYEAKIMEDYDYELSFTPEYDGTYKFYSFGDKRASGLLYNDSGKCINIDSEDGEGANFLMEEELEAGKTYILKFECYSNSCDDTFPVTICASKVSGKATAVVIDRDSETLTYGALSETHIGVYSTPFDAETEKLLQWTSSNEDVVYVKKGSLYFISEGAATITVTTENGLTDSIDVVVTKTPELIVNMANEAVCLDGDKIVYEFTPKLSGSYTLYSLGDDNPAMSLYNKNMEEIGESDNEGEKLNFYLEADLIAGETYYISYYISSVYFDVVAESTINITYKDQIAGDVNCDGRINMIDLALVKQAIVGGWKPSLIETSIDFNDDSRANNGDVILLKRFIVGGYGVEIK